MHPRLLPHRRPRPINLVLNGNRRRESRLPPRAFHLTRTPRPQRPKLQDVCKLRQSINASVPSRPAANPSPPPPISPADRGCPPAWDTPHPPPSPSAHPHDCSPNPPSAPISD